jgi:hypothetical protein
VINPTQALALQRTTRVVCCYVPLGYVRDAHPARRRFFGALRDVGHLVFVQPRDPSALSGGAPLGVWLVIFTAQAAARALLVGTGYWSTALRLTASGSAALWAPRPAETLPCQATLTTAHGSRGEPTLAGWPPLTGWRQSQALAQEGLVTYDSYDKIRYDKLRKPTALLCGPISYGPKLRVTHGLPAAVCRAAVPRRCRLWSWVAASGRAPLPAAATAGDGCTLLPAAARPRRPRPHAAASSIVVLPALKARRGC